MTMASEIKNSEAVGWNRAQQLTMAVLQRSQVRFPALTRWLTIVLNSTSREPDISSDRPGCQAHTGYTYAHVG